MKRIAVYCLSALLFAPVVLAANEERSKFGVAPAVSVDGTIIWAGHALANANLFPAAPGALAVISTSADDAPGGAVGATDITIQGLYATGCDTSTVVEREVTAILNGLGSVAVDTGQASCWFRVNRAWVVGDGDNVGRVEIRIGTEIVAVIDPTVGQTEQAALSIMSPITILSSSAHLLAGSGVSPSMIVKVFTRPWGGARRVRALPMVITENAPKIVELFSRDVYVEANADVWVEAFDVVAGSGDLAAQLIYRTH